jgi:penicillin-binding protein 1A
MALCALMLQACGIVTFSTGNPIELVREPQTSRVFAFDGTLIAELHGVENREDVTLAEVPLMLQAAVIAIEDRRFYTHSGVDIPAIGRALLANIEAGAIEQGGSTITQQYVKNTITGSAVTAERKVEEAALAMQLEEQLSKDQILERYLNSVYFGAGAYGVSAAARTYFGAEPDELKLDQATLLAGLIRTPHGLDPFRNPDGALARRSQVLDALVAVGELTRAEADEADGMPLQLALPSEQSQGPTWFLDEARRQIIEGDTFAVLGPTPDDRVDALLTGGLRITTTLDTRIQAHAEDAVATILSEQGDPSAAVVVIEPSTGRVRAIVGGRAKDHVAGGFSLATQGLRQPGSSFKPLVLAAALDRGVSLERIFPAGACVSFPEVVGWERGVCNYGGADYGAISLREGTVRSVNTVYARLGVELGPTAMADTAYLLGIRSTLPPVEALALGAGEVSPFELASAYTSFATLGVQHPSHLITRITDADGGVLYEHVDEALQVLDEGVAHFVTRTLEEVVARGTGARADIDRPQAGKTGTSQDSADAWFVGYTPDLVAAVWVGFPQGRIAMTPPRTRELVEGGRWPAQIWAATMGPALASVPATPFSQPTSGVEILEVDVSRNCLPNPYTPPELIEAREYPPGAAPTTRCTEPTGPPVDDVPDVRGLPLDLALAQLADGGFAIEQRPIQPTLFPSGYVERQRPEPGDATLAADENAVVLWVATPSRARVLVPDVLSLQRRDAVAALEAAGFVVDIRSGCVLDPCGPAGSVEAQDPPPTARQRQYAVVTLTVSPT